MTFIHLIVSITYNVDSFFCQKGDSLRGIHSRNHEQYIFKIVWYSIKFNRYFAVHQLSLKLKEWKEVTKCDIVLSVNGRLWIFCSRGLLRGNFRWLFCFRASLGYNCLTLILRKICTGYGLWASVLGLMNFLLIWMQVLT